MRQTVARASATTAYLPTAELAVYVLGYALLLGHGAQQLYHLGPQIFRASSTEPDWLGRSSEYFRRGWLLGPDRPEEIDHEFDHWWHCLISHAPWFALHAALALATTALRINVRHLRFQNLALGVAYFLCNYGLAPTGVLLTTCGCSLYIVRHFRSRPIVWMFTLAGLIAIQSTDRLPHWTVGLSDSAVYEVHTIAAWTCLRFVSVAYGLIEAEAGAEKKDEEEAEVKLRPTIWDALAYILYVPVLVCGPIVIFGRYMDMLEHRRRVAEGTDKSALFSTGLAEFLRQIAAIALALLAASAMRHCFYLESVRNLPEFYDRMPLPALYAFGYLMGVGFWLLYSFTYGWALAMARLDGMRVPRTPRFIGRVHLYSDMWKHFDHGLYECLFGCVYRPLCGGRAASVWRRVAASAVVFAVIVVFHGMHDFVLVWVAINFGVVVVEMVARRWWRKDGGKEVVGQWVSVAWRRRLVAVAGAQLLVPAVLSNMYYFGGIGVGDAFMRRTYVEADWWDYAGVSAVAVCMWHTSEWWASKVEDDKKPAAAQQISRE